MTSSNGTIFRATGPLCGEFTGPGEFPAQWPVTRSFDVFFDLHLNKRLSKQPWGWWFETPPWSLWRQCNASYRLVNRGPGWDPCLPRSFDMTLTLTVYCSGVIKQDYGLLITFPFKNGHSVHNNHQSSKLIPIDQITRPPFIHLTTTAEMSGTEYSHTFGNSGGKQRQPVIRDDGFCPPFLPIYIKKLSLLFTLL